VDTRVAEVRRVLGDDPAEPMYIETVPGQGYRFVGRVEVGV
jgi:DNA-binding winged helix-turn-helix (wHTH) protein